MNYRLGPGWQNSKIHILNSHSKGKISGNKLKFARHDNSSYAKF